MARPASLPASVPGPGRMVRRFWPQIRRRRWLIGGSFAALAAEILFRLLEPWPLKFVFDRVIPETPAGGASGIAILDALDPVRLLALSAVSLVVVVLLRSCASYLSTVGFAVAGNRILTEVRSELFAHLQRLSLSFHDKARTGDLLTRVLGDIGRLQEVTVTAVLPLLAHVLTLAGMLALMTWMNWRLSLVALAVVPLFVLASRRLGGRIRRAARQQRRREGELGATAAEAIGAIKVVQALSLEDVHGAAFARQNDSSYKEGVKAKRLSARLERSVDVLIAIGTALVVWFGAGFVLRGELTPGDLIVFLAYLKNAFKPMRDVAKYTGRIAKAAASGERVLEVLEQTPAVQDEPGAIEAPPQVASLRFEEVGFAYDGEHAAVEGFALDAEPGQVIALTGPSGAGKSTIMSLLLRLYDPSHGRIRLNDRCLRDYTVRSLRSRIAIVPQESVLFAVPVRENIAYGLPGAEPDRIEAAARLARAHDFIMAMPDGYDTIVGERGETLSGGQRQRIAIARAVIRGAPILVFDEPTASLDEENARLLREALRDLRRDRITFIIAHDLTLAAEADRVVHLDGGRLVEQGTHEQLLRANGRYAAAYRAQVGTGGPPAPKGKPHALAG